MSNIFGQSAQSSQGGHFIQHEQHLWPSSPEFPSLGARGVHPSLTRVRNLPFGFSSESLVFLWAKEQSSDSRFLKGGSLPLLSCKEQQEQIALGHKKGKNMAKTTHFFVQIARFLRAKERFALVSYKQAKYCNLLILSYISDSNNFTYETPCSLDINYKCVQGNSELKLIKYNWGNLITLHLWVFKKGLMLYQTELLSHWKIYSTIKKSFGCTVCKLD